MVRLGLMKQIKYNEITPGKKAGKAKTEGLDECHDTHCLYIFPLMKHLLQMKGMITTLQPLIVNQLPKEIRSLIQLIRWTASWSSSTGTRGTGRSTRNNF